jgi:uncharacterized membrane protein
MAAMATLVGAPLAAQDTQEPPGMMGQGMGMMQMCSMMSMMGGQGMMGMMDMMPTGPQALLAARAELGLSDEQVAQLEELAEGSSGEHAADMEAAKQARREASQELATEDPDLDSYRRSLEGAAEHMIAAHMTMTKTSIDALTVLTEEQKAEVKHGMSLVGHMMCGMGDNSGANHDHGG